MIGVSMNNTDIIKDKINILDVVTPYVKLEKAGKTWKGKSPFNNEKTPSFFVNPEKGFFYCFSSGKGGDIFTFIQEMEKIEFGEALKLLAERAGVTLHNTQHTHEEHSHEQRLFDILDVATKWYEVNLRKNKDAIDYLLSRGLTKDTIIKFRIGFAQDSWRDVYEYLKHKKYTDSDIEQVGLIIPKQGSGYYDRFRSRIMFPLFDARGRVVGFSGRIWGDDDNAAKYINSPEGLLFDKSSVLYGYHTAKSAISKANACILVEGQFDVLMSQQAGHINTVAISGTGLTDGHIAMISRFTDTLILSLDSDNAGIKATRRSVIAAYQKGLKVKVAVLDHGYDPADVIKTSPAAWDVAIADAQHYIDYRLLIYNREKHSFEEKMDLIQKDIFEFVAYINSAVLQDSFLQKISLFLGVSVESVRKDFAGYTPQEIKPESSKHTDTKHTPHVLSREQECVFMYAYLQDQNITLPVEYENQYKALCGQSLKEALTGYDSVTLHMHIFRLEQLYLDKNPDFVISQFLNILIHIQIGYIDTELRDLDQKIKKEQLENPHILTDTLKDLMKQSTILLTRKQDLSAGNHNQPHA